MAQKFEEFKEFYDDFNLISASVKELEEDCKDIGNIWLEKSKNKISSINKYYKEKHEMISEMLWLTGLNREKGIFDSSIKKILHFTDRPNQTEFNSFMKTVNKNLLVIRSLMSIMFRFYKSTMPVHKKFIDQLRHGSTYTLNIHRLGFGRKVKGKEILEKQIDLANSLVKEINNLNTPWMRKVQITIDCDFFWIHNPDKKDKVRMFFGHPKAVFRVKDAKKLNAMRKTESRVAHVDYVLKNAHPDLHFTIDLKFGVGDYKAAINQLIDIIYEYKKENNVMFHSQNLEFLEIVKQRNPDFPTVIFSKNIPLSSVRFHTPTHFSWKELRKSFFYRIGSMPNFVDGSVEHGVKSDLKKFMHHVKYFQKKGKFAYPFLIGFWLPQKGRDAKRRLMVSYLSGASGGYIERSTVPELLEFMKDPFGL